MFKDFWSWIFQMPDENKVADAADDDDNTVSDDDDSGGADC